ncbi:MAG: hypothetical protein WDM96_00960 [Lacunisphaera sp.]
MLALVEFGPAHGLLPAGRWTPVSTPALIVDMEINDHQTTGVSDPGCTSG